MTVLLAALLVATWVALVVGVVLVLRVNTRTAAADRQEREFLIRVALSRHVGDVATMDQSRSEAAARIVRAAAPVDAEKLMAEIAVHLDGLGDDPAFVAPAQPEGL